MKLYFTTHHHTMFVYTAYGVAACFGIVLLFGTVYFVEEKSVAVIQRLGKFHRISNAGMGIKIPIVDWVADRVNLKMQQMDVAVETKTQDNVFVKMEVSVQYQVIPAKVYDAFYRLNDPKAQINSYVYDVVRASVPKMKLDEVFEKKDDIAKGIKESLDKTMNEFGFDIINALVTDIDPDEKVKIAMNQINAAQRLREAAEQEGEAKKIMIVKAAEAEAESKKLQGIGIANQRKAIVEGLKDSVEAFQKGVEGVSATDVMGLVVITQYFDTLKDIGASNNSSVILTPHSPGGLASIQEQIMESFAAAKRVK